MLSKTELESMKIDIQSQLDNTATKEDFQVLKVSVWSIEDHNFMNKLHFLQIDVSKRALKTELEKIQFKSLNTIIDVPEVQTLKVMKVNKI